MAGRLLFLAHRLPYPPDKGERIRAWHMLERLARHWEIDLGCLSDDPADAAHLPMLRRLCHSVHCEPLGSRLAVATRALLRARPGLPLTLGWFHDRGLKSWVDATIAARRPDAAFVYSSAMAPYVMDADVPLRVLDLVDVDSEKWRAYAADARAPRRQLWAREARTLLAFERRAAAGFDRTILVSQAERARFVALAPEVADRVDHVDNGVDLARFNPALRFENPYTPGRPALVFTGTMDYRPNIEAVTWFAEAVMPLLRQADAAGPAVEFHIVGTRPTPAVRALAALPGVHVTGRVADTRPYMAHAAVAVAPLQIARGIQNKVLEAMAMGRAVVASPAAFEGVRARVGQDLLVADGVAETLRAVLGVLRGEYPDLGRAARGAMEQRYSWDVTLRRLDAVLPALTRVAA